jgi:polysaccharide pyruvyl transferase CsaB
MTRAVVLGYQGFGNVGDEAILTGIECLLDGAPIEVIAVIGGPEPIRAFPRAQRLPTRRLRPTRQALRALRRADLLLLSGGGLVNDHWAATLPLYLGWSALARLLGARIAWIGVGIGPLRRRRSRLLAGAMARLATLVTVRDDPSAALARSVAPGRVVRVVPDPAVFNPAPTPRSRGGIGFIVRAPAPGDAELAADLAAALGREIGAAAGAGTADPVILTFGGPADAPFAERVAIAARRFSDTAAAIESMPPDPARVLARLAALEALVSVRLHGLILGAIAGTPTVPVAYDDKVTAVAAQLGIDDLALSLADLVGGPAGEVGRRIAVASQPGRQDLVARRLGELRSQAEPLRDLVRSLGERGGGR